MTTALPDKRKVMVIPVNEEDFISALRLAETLRNDLPLEITTAFTDKTLNSNMRTANNQQIPIVILVDKSRWGNDVIIKRMSEDRLQSQIPAEVICKTIKEWLKISPVEDILINFKSGNLETGTAEFLLDMYYKKGYV